MAGAVNRATFNSTRGPDSAEISLPPRNPDELENWALAALGCPQCGMVLERLATAKFCPRCGARLAVPPVPVIPATDAEMIASEPYRYVDKSTPAPSPPRMPPPPLPPLAALAPLPETEPEPHEDETEAVLSELQRLHESGAFLPPDAVTAAATAQPPASPKAVPRSPIVAGYATALYRLGWRYERHLGFERNVSEAVRCYLKAARLGNSDAVARLASDWAGRGKDRG